MKPYSAAPLTDEQRAEVLRVMSECAAQDRHAYMVMINGERGAAVRELAGLGNRPQPDPDRARVVAEAQLAAFDRALSLLETCWPAQAAAEALRSPPAPSYPVLF